MLVRAAPGGAAVVPTDATGVGRGARGAAAGAGRKAGSGRGVTGSGRGGRGTGAAAFGSGGSALTTSFPHREQKRAFGARAAPHWEQKIMTTGVAKTVPQRGSELKNSENQKLKQEVRRTSLPRRKPAALATAVIDLSSDVGPAGSGRRGRDRVLQRQRAVAAC